MIATKADTSNFDKMVEPDLHLETAWYQQQLQVGLLIESSICIASTCGVMFKAQLQMIWILNRHLLRLYTLAEFQFGVRLASFKAVFRRVEMSGRKN